MPFRRERYCHDWELVSLAIRERAAGRCEWCKAAGGQPHPVTGSRVVLTVAHLNHDPSDNDPDNLRALCNRCHLRYDHARHVENARRTRAEKLASGQRDLFGEPA